ncbi:phosphoserine phosphatase [Vibrio sp. SCSIO 43136]|uniref:phosphoserine phosphatase n=1 Tax=Vibrio sp. SCSIO 43136 TaxID=2819101 RepID=UPI00207517F4|nr:phosphoserine phosphatase [Vibrio sp. SCSIO 43136]USD64748.1 phosphoserine phosphatase [Vibrio sp. SCSIO 43136]
MTALKISKRTTLRQRFPETQTRHFHDRKTANWIVFGHYLSPKHFEDLDFFTGTFNPIIECWQVGPYEVALMAGDITPEHQTILSELNLDYASLTDVPDMTKPGLLLMDMDSTAIQIECIDEIAKLAGVGEMVAEVTERAMQGELDFEQSLRQRVGALKDADQAILETVRQQIPLMPEVIELVDTLKAFGWKTAIASGGFTYFSDEVKSQLGLDFAQSNQLEIIDGKLTGEVLGEVVSAQTKADILAKLVEEYDFDPYQSIAVGDGANDLVMMAAAGLGVAYHAKPKVQQQAQTAVNVADLGGVVCILSGQLAKLRKLSW